MSENRVLEWTESVTECFLFLASPLACPDPETVRNYHEKSQI